MNTRLLSFLLLFGLLLTAGTKLAAQARVYVGANFLLRNQVLTIDDPGGNFLPGFFRSRITYDLGIEVKGNSRFSFTTGVQRIFFAHELTFAPGPPIPLFHPPSRPPITGIQIPLGVRCHFIRNSSPSRWRLGVQGGVNLAFVEPGGRIRVDHIDRGSDIIIAREAHEMMNRCFVALDVGIFAKYRLSDRVNLIYTYSFVQSLAGPVSVQHVSYQVTTGGVTQQYTARTESNGSASLHGLGLQFALVR